MRSTSTNDVSAYSGKVRPQYQRMLADLQDGQRDAVIVYHVDRLTRRPLELEQFVSALDAAKVKRVRFVVGDMDLGTGDGLMIARMLGAMAAHESQTKSRRVLRKMDQNAGLGLPHGGWHRPFGYDEDKITVRRDEATVIQILAARFLAGESLRSLACWLDVESVQTVSGKPWRTPTLRAMLASARTPGLREHRGEVVGPAIWEAIISEDEHRRIQARMIEKTMAKRRTPQRYLLTGTPVLWQVREPPLQQPSCDHPPLCVPVRSRSRRLRAPHWFKCSDGSSRARRLDRHCALTDGILTRIEQAIPMLLNPSSLHDGRLVGPVPQANASSAGAPQDNKRVHRLVVEVAERAEAVVVEGCVGPGARGRHERGPSPLGCRSETRVRARAKACRSNEVSRRKFLLDLPEERRVARLP